MKEKENNVLDTRLVEQLLISDPTDRRIHQEKNEKDKESRKLVIQPKYVCL